MANALGHEFADLALLVEALTHPSANASAKAKAADYDRLEFLGDRVLGLVVADMLSKRFPEAQAGELAVRLNALVRQESLAAIARAIGLGDFLILSSGERRAGGADKPAILANALEAVIAALYRDGGLRVARTFIERQFKPRLDQEGSGAKDAKTRLQEWAAARALTPPKYTVLSEDGPAHAPTFLVEVTIAKTGSAQGAGGTKRVAEQAAASKLLAELAKIKGRK